MEAKSDYGASDFPSITDKSLHLNSEEKNSPNNYSDDDNKPPSWNPEAKEFYPEDSDDNLDIHSDFIPSSDSLAGTPSPCVWVGNVSPEITEDDFRKEFEQFGRVILIRMFPKSKCAFVTFSDSNTALRSLALEGKLIGSMRLTLNVGMASRHLWVGNVTENIREEDLRESFGKFGKIESIRILASNNCAFVNFGSETEALTAAENMNGVVLGDQELVINFQWTDAYKKQTNGNGDTHQFKPTRSNRRRTGQNKSKEIRKSDTQFSTPSRQLFVGNIGPNVAEQTLYNLFSGFGEIESIKSFAHRGYAFVVFRNLNQSIWAREQMMMYPPVLDGMPLTVNYGRIRSNDQEMSFQQPSHMPGPFYFVPLPITGSQAPPGMYPSFPLMENPLDQKVLIIISSQYSYSQDENDFEFEEGSDPENIS